MGRSLASSGSVLGFQPLSVHEPTPVAGCRPACAAGLWIVVSASADTAIPVRKIVGFQPIIGTPAARVHEGSTNWPPLPHGPDSARFGQGPGWQNLQLRFRIHVTFAQRCGRSPVTADEYPVPSGKAGVAVGNHDEVSGTLRVFGSSAAAPSSGRVSMTSNPPSGLFPADSSPP